MRKARFWFVPHAFSRLATGDFTPADGPLQALAPLARYPARIACARLAWEALRDALVGCGE